MGKSNRSDAFRFQAGGEVCLRVRLRSHRLDEFAASYSLAGWSPPEHTSASPADSILNRTPETVNLIHRWGGGLFDWHHGEIRLELTSSS
jgi:hypothetical protein